MQFSSSWNAFGNTLWCQQLLRTTTIRQVNRCSKQHYSHHSIKNSILPTKFNRSGLGDCPPNRRLMMYRAKTNVIIQPRNASTTTTASSASSSSSLVKEPSFKTLQLVAFTTSIPFVGFGFMDNAILIIAGDYIDTTLGVMLGISTLCAAAIGNIISDLFGIGLGTIIEDFCANTLKLPVPQLSTAQRQLRSVRYASQFGMAVGMTVGCIVGMFPLWFIDTHKADKLRKKAQLENLCQDVLLEGKTLIGSETTTLYLRVNLTTTANVDKRVNVDEKDDNGVTTLTKTSTTIKGSGGESSYSSSTSTSTSGGASVLPFKPSPTGEYLYAMYYEIPSSCLTFRGGKDGTTPNLFYHPHHDSTSSLKRGERLLSFKDTGRIQERWIPVGRGIVSRAVLTGDTWNIADVTDEPDFFPITAAAAAAANKKMKTNTMTASTVSSSSSSSGLVDRSRESCFRNMVVVPVLDGRGRAIGVLEALNKIPKDEDDEEDGFTDQDVEILKSLASHISVSLQVFYQDAEDGELRLRDTIRIFKEMGIQGITDSNTQMGLQGSVNGDAMGTSLFPSNSTVSSSKVRNARSSSKLFPTE